MAMTIQHIAAFSHGEHGGNPAGGVVGEVMPDGHLMQAMAARLGYSETAFACPARSGWRIRYFAPAREVPFCGHATIALGAALAWDHGFGTQRLHLNDASITVEGHDAGAQAAIALHSPPTRSAAALGPLVTNNNLAIGKPPRRL